MKGNYFGHHCKFFSGVWETCDVQADTEGEEHYKNYEPVLNCCSHPENPDGDTEGACQRILCPLIEKDGE